MSSLKEVAAIRQMLMQRCFAFFGKMHLTQERKVILNSENGDFFVVFTLQSTGTHSMHSSINTYITYYIISHHVMVWPHKMADFTWTTITA